jgi:two-component system KDP operon response regulator KdpE
MARTSSLRQLFARTFDRIAHPPLETDGKDSASLIESGDFRIDLAKKTAELLGQELQLTGEEFDVLVFLAGHRQRLVTPHTVLATNWTASRLRQTEFLKVLLSLRAKFDAVRPGEHYLRTEPWVLYRFDPTSSASSSGV